MRHLLVLCVGMLLSDDACRAMFRRALELAGCTAKQAYTDMGMSQTQFSKQMSGEEPARCLARLHKIQNINVARWYFLLGMQAVGVPPEVIKADYPRLALMLQQRRQLKASLTEPELRKDRTA